MLMLTLCQVLLLIAHLGIALGTGGDAGDRYGAGAGDGAGG